MAHHLVPPDAPGDGAANAGLPEGSPELRDADTLVNSPHEPCQELPEHRQGGHADVFLFSCLILDSERSYSVMGHTGLSWQVQGNRRGNIYI